MLPTEIKTIYCIGRNYTEHAKELGNPVPQSPVVFLKPATAFEPSGGSIRIPAVSERVDHEVELVLLVGQAGRNIGIDQAWDHIAAVAVGVDVTARDLQDQAKAKSLPWAVAKGFDSFAPIGNWVPVSEVLAKGQNRDQLKFWIEVNGQRRQNGDTAEMLFSVPVLISYLSTIFTLRPGDVIFTGTPAGVAPLQSGDKIVAALEPGLSRLELLVFKENH